VDRWIRIPSSISRARSPWAGSKDCWEKRSLPDGTFIYVNYTDVNGDTHVTEFAMKGDRVDVGSRRDVLFVEQPYTNHNGGGLVFGPDGHLYIGLGDGGSGGDPHGNGQSLSTLLGKMLRISPRPSGDRPYTVPTDNPFTDDGDARPEIWAFGLRNPWRFCFDRETGDLWIGDVGQSSWEEVDVQPADSRGGENFGWNVMEGGHEYGDALRTPDMVPPVYEYSHDDGGCALTGGYVYRGRAIPALQGAYVFGDFCGGRLVHTAPQNLQSAIDGIRVSSPGGRAFGLEYDLRPAAQVRSKPHRSALASGLNPSASRVMTPRAADGPITSAMRDASS
jgi:glucose/arabinose dehydrogenase